MACIPWGKIKKMYVFIQDLYIAGPSSHLRHDFWYFSIVMWMENSTI